MKTITSIYTLIFLTLVSALLTHPATAAEWGTLKGRLVVDGDAPEPLPFKPTKDNVCILAKPKNETLLVGENGALANGVIYIRVKRGKSVDVHPDYAAGLEEKVVLDNKGCAFIPHITLVRVGQPFAIKNSDPTGHNTNAALMKNGSFNVLIAEGEEKLMPLKKGESMPMPIQCNVHPFMNGYLLVRDDPYMAVSSEDGTFEIANIPAGKHEFQFWHEVSGYLKKAKYDGGALNKKGRAKLEIPAGGVLDLGDIRVPASMLQ